MVVLQRHDENCIPSINRQKQILDLEAPKVKELELDLESEPVEAGYEPPSLDVYVLNPDGQIITGIKYEQPNSRVPVNPIPLKIMMKVLQTQDTSLGPGNGEMLNPPRKIHFGDVSGMLCCVNVYVCQRGLVRVCVADIHVT
jgi:hypothetical protein